MADEFKKMMTAGEMATEPKTVELPVSSEYITPEGMYVAGYWWGRKGRGTTWLPSDDPSFVMGVEDGNGDWLGDVTAKVEAKKEKSAVKPFDPDKENLDVYHDMLAELQMHGIISRGEYESLMNKAIETQVDSILNTMKGITMKGIA